MPVIHVEQWYRRYQAEVRAAVELRRSLRQIERSLRAQGFHIAADLVATAGIAVQQKDEMEHSSR